MAKFSTRDIVVTLISEDTELEIKDLHISAEVTRTLSQSPNTAEIEIFNLNKANRDFLNSIYDENDAPNLKVQVEVDNKVLFKGDIVNAISKYSLGEWTTSIYGNEHYLAYRKKAKIETKKGDTREDVLNTMFDSLKDVGLNTVDIQAIRNKCGNKSILKRLIYDGNVIDNIKKLINDCLPQNDVTIDEDKLNIIPKSSALEKDTLLDFFLEAPQLNEKGCVAKVPLNTEIKAGAKITLEAKSYNQSFGNLTVNRARRKAFSGEGTYKVIEILHTVDNYTDQVAQTEVTGVLI